MTLNFEKSKCFFKSVAGIISSFFSVDVYFGRNISSVPGSSIVFFPCPQNLLCCGLAGIVSCKIKKAIDNQIDMASLDALVDRIEASSFKNSFIKECTFDGSCLAEAEHIDSLSKTLNSLKREDRFYEIFIHDDIQNAFLKLAERISGVIDIESGFLSDYMGRLNLSEVDAISKRIEVLKDIRWCIKSEILDNIDKVKSLLSGSNTPPDSLSVKLFKKINAVLNSIDYLEVRGRDSAGISLIFILDTDEFGKFTNSLKDANLIDLLEERSAKNPLVNMGISVRCSKNCSKDSGGRDYVTVAMTYKVAAEIGSLGDNTNFLRGRIKDDPILKKVILLRHRYNTVFAHTRWASVGAVSEPNCHPVDNKTSGKSIENIGIIHACLNGDIDNYPELKKEYEADTGSIDKDITTDTKIIPLWIEKYINDGFKVEEAFRLAVNDFKGSHAIAMYTDLAPDRFFLAQKGSGQAVFVGLSDNQYIPASEVYGFIEETNSYLKMNGEVVADGQHGMTQGQIFMLNQESCGGIDGIKAIYYDGTPVELKADDIKCTDITSRDIDRQDFSHYFLKEISESPDSVEKTLFNRWKITDNDSRNHVITLDENVIPQPLHNALSGGLIRRIFFIGQGTAGIAAQVCANILNYYMKDPLLNISAVKASELSGFTFSEHDDENSMADSLVVAISQSGTTTDTNRTVDMAKKRGAHTLAIVNRRDSDITFKVDGVMYTSSGRDIEMSVASTKAFYSQIVAGAILSLYIARVKNTRDDDFVSDEIKQLLALPSHMRKILSMSKEIKTSANRLAVGKPCWAAVGSGPNKASADEIRIKLSELCYKIISSDFVEDKKHIDLSSEPLIVVCAAGTKDTVIGDIIKDTAIFQAHKAVPVVIADEGEERFEPFAEDVFHVPVVKEHLAPVLNTLVGHIWGYYAALAINEGSKFFNKFREELQEMINGYSKKEMSVYEVVLEKSFREKIARFYAEFRRKNNENRLPTCMGLQSVSDLTLLLKYLSGRLPVSDFELDFGQKGTALNMLNRMFECLGESINIMSRPVDAIKHQAKTVTVGTSRISEKVKGIIFKALAENSINLSRLTNRNIIVLKHLQEIISKIKGSILYRIKGLNILGEPTDETTIEIADRKGTSKSIPSRVEKDSKLKGTKKIILRQGNVYIGKGRKDGRSILVIPAISSFSSAPNVIEHLLLLNISFKRDIPLPVKIKALGGKYENIKNIVQENNIIWDDKFLESVEIEELFGKSAEKIAEFIIALCVSND